MQQHLETTTKGVIPIMKSQIRLPTKSRLEQKRYLMNSVLQLLFIKSGKFLRKFFDTRVCEMFGLASTSGSKEPGIRKRLKPSSFKRRPCVRVSQSVFDAEIAKLLFSNFKQYTILIVYC